MTFFKYGLSCKIFASKNIHERHIKKHKNQLNNTNFNNAVYKLGV